MIYVITYTGQAGFVGFQGGRHTTKHEAERTLADCTTGLAADFWQGAGRSNFTLRQFKNMGEAAAWRDANLPNAKPEPETIDDGYAIYCANVADPVTYDEWLNR
jgi:hypothetical protein